MPVAINFGDDFASHEDAEAWRIDTECGEAYYELLDEDHLPIGVEAPVRNVCQIQALTQEEYDELLEMF
jgi:hypothetical protein